MYFDVDNDGILISAQRISGTGSANFRLYSELPDPMSAFYVDSITVNQDVPVQGAFVTDRRIRVDVSWDSAIEVRLVVRLLSGEGVLAWKAQVAPKDTSTDEYRAAISGVMDELRVLNRAILNHLRYITQLEETDGEYY